MYKVRTSMHGWPRKVYSQLSHELKWSDTNELILLYVRTRMYVLLCLAENEALQCCSKGCYTLRCLPWLHAMLTSASAVGTQRCLMNNSCVVGGEGWLWTVQETQVNLKGWSLPIEANIRPQHFPTSNEHDLTVYRFSNSNAPNQQSLISIHFLYGE